MQWQRTLRIVLVVFFLGLVAAVALTMRSRKPAAATGTVERADPTAAVELPEGAEFTWTEKGREVFTVAFKRGLTYPDGRSVFAQARVRIPDRGGRTVEIAADTAEAVAPTGQPRRATFRGNVVLSSSDGMKLDTAEAAYSEADRTVRVPGMFTFARGRTSGSGRCGRYDQNADAFVVKGDARLRVAPDAAGGDPMDVRAGAATIDRAQHVIRFEQHATVTSGPQSAEADTLLAYLTPDDERVARVELRGAARVTHTAAAAGALRAMQAREIDLAYGADGRTLQRAQLRGQSVLEVAGTTAANRRLAAESIDVDLGADGRTLQQLRASQRVQLDLPAEAGTRARSIRSNALQGTGGAEGLRNVTFTGAVDYRESAAARGSAPALDRAARADRLDATLKPGFGAPESAVFRGAATIRDGDATGEAGVATYAPDKNLMLLETPAGVAGPTPRVADGQVTVSAARVEMTLEPRRLQAKGDVRSTITQAGASRTSGGAAGPGERRRPAMLAGKEPINVTADTLAYDAESATGTYTGGARLWQGDTTIQADTLVLDDKAGTLTGTKDVRTRMMLEQVNKQTKATERVESIGSADQFAYDDGPRRATYTGGAHLTGPQGDVTAERIELFLNEGGRTLQRAEAYDNVVARLEGGQQAFGTRLTYYGSDERYEMSGTPVKILETVEGGCRETSGAALTFTRSTDTISVVGTEGNRSRTTPGRCQERASSPRERSSPR